PPGSGAAHHPAARGRRSRPHRGPPRPDDHHPGQPRTHLPPVQRSGRHGDPPRGRGGHEPHAPGHRVHRGRPHAPPLGHHRRGRDRRRQRRPPPAPGAHRRRSPQVRDLPHPSAPRTRPPP